MIKPNRKLTLCRETVKTLRVAELVAVIGGEASAVSNGNENCVPAVANLVLPFK